MTLTLNAVINIFYGTLWLMMLRYETKFACKRTGSLEDRKETVIFSLYKPLLWPWHWRQRNHFSAWHSGSRYCTIKPSLVSKWSAIQKISSGQTFTDILNLCCDLDLERRNQVLHRTLRLMMLYYKTKFGCKRTSSLEDRVKIVICWSYRPLLWPWQWR